MIKIFGSKLQVTSIYVRDVGKQINKNVLTGRYERFGVHPLLQSRDIEFYLLTEELKLFHRWFHSYLWMLVAQFRVLLQMLANHVRKRSGNCLTCPTDWRYFAVCHL